jgi:mono/diheme cytochrome c family protein
MRAVRAFLGIIVAAAAVAAIVRYQTKPDAAATVALPDRTYSPAMFDTVVWANEASALARGKDVFAWVCAKCHGPTGLGDGGEVVEGDTLHPPSFQAPEWRFAEAPQSLWQRIYLGNNRGMPHWGDQGLQPRDIVAVATYIQKDLRKNVK